MKLSTIFLTLSLSVSAFAQTPATKPRPATAGAVVKHTTTTPVRTPGCAKLPELSPKIPALPAGLPCAKPLYTITVTPSAKLDYVAPIESAGLAEFLGLEPSSFSLDYIDTKIGDGGLAAPLTFYTIHYNGYLVDGTKFDSSYDKNEPITIAYGQHQVIPGWDTGLAGMKIGGKRRLFIPFQLAYGTQAHGPIPAKSMLIFDVELVSASDTPPPPKANEKPAPPPASAPAPPPAAKPATPPASAPAAAPAKPATAPAATPAKP